MREGGKIEESERGVQRIWDGRRMDWIKEGDGRFVVAVVASGFLLVWNP